MFLYTPTCVLILSNTYLEKYGWIDLTTLTILSMLSTIDDELKSKYIIKN
ncbi:hypothetical protein Sjap_011191 [Stephania japonica]|uniref:Uncharacterized protein n=1 Tax=Stephania japonica TaxID=461633 RepID=A0AAP0P5A8_9MAGN